VPKVGVLTVSDRASKGLYADLSGPIIVEVASRPFLSPAVPCSTDQALEKRDERWGTPCVVPRALFLSLSLSLTRSLSLSLTLSVSFCLGPGEQEPLRGPLRAHHR